MPYEVNEMFDDDSNPLSDNFSIHNADTWDQLLDSKMDAQRNALGLTDNQKFPYSSYSGENAITRDEVAPLNPFPQVVPGVAGVQAVVDRYSNKQSPVTGNDFIRVARDVGVPLDLMLAQAIAESNIGTAGRAARTHNIFNVGNVDSGANTEMNDWVAGMYAYAKLIKDRYFPVGAITASAEQIILPQFVARSGPNKGSRYASNPQYEDNLIKILAIIRPLLGN